MEKALFVLQQMELLSIIARCLFYSDLMCYQTH